MAVRNLKSIGGSKPIPIYVWIPPTWGPIYKVIVNDIDVTEDIIEGSYVDGITETIGSFNFKVNNSNEAYSSSFNLYDYIKIYLDYGTTATTLRFTGLLERISKSDNNIVLTGRGSAVRVLTKVVTYSATNKARSEILSEIISNYFPSITTTNLSEDLNLSTVSYSEKPFWEVVQEICKLSGYDAYVDHNLDFNYFSSGSKENTTECVVHEYNIISVGDFSPDLQSVANRVRVYGATINGLPIIATAEDLDSQTSLKGDKKDLIINDSSITTYELAKARADYELATLKDPPTVGEVTCLGLPTIEPGERIRISDPVNGLNPSYYTIQSFTHNFSNDEPFQTVLTVQKDRLTISDMIKKRVKFESEIQESVNASDLDYSYLWVFDTNYGTHINTLINVSTNYEIGSGTLVTDGSSTGTWISDIVTLENQPSTVECRVAGENVITGSSATVEVWLSLDGGTVYKQVFPGVSGTEMPTGVDAMIKVIIKSADTKIKSISLLYS